MPHPSPSFTILTCCTVHQVPLLHGRFETADPDVLVVQKGAGPAEQICSFDVISKVTDVLLWPYVTWWFWLLFPGCHHSCFHTDCSSGIELSISCAWMDGGTWACMGVLPLKLMMMMMDKESGGHFSSVLTFLLCWSRHWPVFRFLMHESST